MEIGERRAATAEAQDDDGTYDAGRDDALRDRVDDVRADLDEESRRAGRTLRGAHRIPLRRPYRQRQRVFKEVAKRLNGRRGWKISARTVERIWKGWRSVLRQDNELS